VKILSNLPTVPRSAVVHAHSQSNYCSILYTVSILDAFDASFRRRPDTGSGRRRIVRGHSRMMMHAVTIP
jgi:hypothetical protein